MDNVSLIAYEYVMQCLDPVSLIEYKLGQGSNGDQHWSIRDQGKNFRWSSATTKEEPTVLTNFLLTNALKLDAKSQNDSLVK